MIDYKKYNDYFLSERCAQILVIYKDGSISKEDLFSMRKNLEAYSFLPDSLELRMTICGYQLGGMIIEEDADLSYENFRYAMSRMRSRDDNLLFAINDKHRERLDDIMEEFFAHANSVETLNTMKSRIKYIALSKVGEK